MNKYKMYKISVIYVFLLLLIIPSFISEASDIKENDSFTSSYKVLQEKEEYIVGYSPYYTPLSYTDRSGKGNGIALAVMDKIAEEAGIKVKYVPIDGYEGEIDINLSVLKFYQLDYHTKRSEVYLEFPLMAICDVGVNMDNCQAIGIMDYYFLEDIRNLNPKIGDDAAVIMYDSYEQMETDLYAEKTDAIISSSIMAKEIMETMDMREYYMVPFNQDLQLTMSFSENISPDIVDAFNVVISTISHDEVYIISIEETMEATKFHTLSDVLIAYKKELALVFTSTMMLIVSVILMHIMKKRRNLMIAMDRDELTGLASEEKFLREARKIINTGSNSYAIIAMDIDNFKYINEVYGYDVGTKVLKLMANHLRTSFTDALLIARVFADHFLILVPKCIEVDEGIICGRENCCDCTRNITQSILGINYNLNVSVGVYNIEDKTMSLSYMIDCANVARASGKDIYGRTHKLFTKNMEKRLKTQNTIVQTMEEGIEHKEFKMVYQPKVELKTSKIVGAEALVRWIKRDGTQVFPDSFIPLFEKNGFITQLDYYVFEQVCGFIGNQEGLPSISVNLSGYTFYDKDVVKTILSILEKHGVSPKQMEIEITESAFVKNFELAIENIERLKKCGFKISMDDFGTGVSSLNRLKDINIDTLKMDKQFLSDSLTRERGLVIVENIIKLSKQLGLEVVAEGVEEKEEVELLRDLNCDLAQGYYYAKPLNGEDFLALLYTDNGVINRDEAKGETRMSTIEVN